MTIDDISIGDAVVLNHSDSMADEYRGAIGVVVESESDSLYSGKSHVRIQFDNKELGKKYTHIKTIGEVLTRFVTGLTK